MEFVAAIFFEVVIVATFGLLTSYLVWKVKKRKTDFGSFLDKYGELLAWAGILVSVVAFAWVRTFLA